MRHRRILETAAGTGMVTRAFVSSLPESLSIVATDLNQPMLDHASSQLPSTRVTWRQVASARGCGERVATRRPDGSECFLDQ
jgi:ubiquinone/menaquinone biosynthesis C-methylase UbiE